MVYCKDIGDNMATMSDIDSKVLDEFRGYVVKKDLVTRLKVGINVPTFVLEYLLANSCSTDNEEQILKGMENVKNILAEHYVNPEQSEWIHSKIREKGKYKIIDKISVELDSKKDIYWAKLQNSNITNANIADWLVKEHDKMLMGGIWAIIDVEYDPTIKFGNSIYPFVISNIKPIQLSSFSNENFVNKRKKFTTEEWKNLLLRSCGYEPESEGITERIKMLLLSRLLPLVEKNFNFIELGPRSTGKSYVFKELTPYAVLISGGQGTVAKLFVHGSTGKIGAVGQWDAICFDESTDKIFREKDAIPLMKDYMESGSFSRAGAGGEITGVASIILNGNINQPVETVLKTSNLFSPLSDEVSNDTAFLDRLHFYLPGWEMIKFKPEHFTSSFGFSTDYFSECLRSMRKITYTDAVEKYFILGKQIRQRDSKPIKKTVSGFIKLFHPDGEYTKEDVRSYLELAIEMRRRIKEQLKKIGGIEFWDTNFSYIDKDTQEEVYISLPEEKSSGLIENNPLQPGVCFTATSNGNNVSLIKVEVITIEGNGKISISGTTNNAIKEDIKNIYQYLKANEKSILSDKYSLSNFDITVQVSNLIGSNIEPGIGACVYAAIISALYKKELKPGLAVLGNVSIGGAIVKHSALADAISMLAENGAKNIVVPVENMIELPSLPATILNEADISFYSNTQALLQKTVIF